MFQSFLVNPCHCCGLPIEQFNSSYRGLLKREVTGPTRNDANVFNFWECIPPSLTNLWTDKCSKRVETIGVAISSSGIWTVRIRIGGEGRWSPGWKTESKNELKMYADYRILSNRVPSYFSILDDSDRSVVFCRAYAKYCFGACCKPLTKANKRCNLASLRERSQKSSSP